MISRATAEAALAAHNAGAGEDGYGQPVDRCLEAASVLIRSELLLMGLLWLVAAGASRKQIDAAWELTGCDPAAKRGKIPPQIEAVMRRQSERMPRGAGDVEVVRLALACLDQGDVSPQQIERLVEVLTWDEAQQDLEAAP